MIKVQDGGESDGVLIGVTVSCVRPLSGGCGAHASGDSASWVMRRASVFKKNTVTHTEVPWRQCALDENIPFIDAMLANGHHKSQRVYILILLSTTKDIAYGRICAFTKACLISFFLPLQLNELAFNIDCINHHKSCIFVHYYKPLSM